MRTINKKLFALLVFASICSVVAVIPYTLTLQGEALQLQELPFPLPVVLLISILQSSVLLSLLIFVGLRMSTTVGLQLPWLQAWTTKSTPPAGLKKMLLSAVVWGAVAGLAIIGFDWLFIGLGVDLRSSAAAAPIWQGLLASLYGAIGEEIQLRLFFMTGIIWIVTRIWRGRQADAFSPRVAWFAIICAAILFGLGHVPITAQLTDLTPLVIARAIILNGVPGVVFGWLYWKRGLEAAMIAHFTTDIVIHVLYPLVIQFV